VIVLVLDHLIPEYGREFHHQQMDGLQNGVFNLTIEVLKQVVMVIVLEVRLLEVVVDGQIRQPGPAAQFQQM
jgi:hypothetical protein